MKKRMLAATLCVLIIALDGCMGESYPKLVANRDEFFSDIAGRYGNSDNNMYIFEDGTFHINKDGDNDYTDSPHTLYQFNGNFKKVYQDSEFCYHTEISRLDKSLSIDSYIYKKPVFNYGPNLEYNLYNFNSFNSNDIIYIYAPGMPIIDIPKTNDSTHYNDKNHDGKLDDYLLVNYPKNHTVIASEEGDYITNGVWIDFDSHKPVIDVYIFDYYEVKVSRYNLSNGKIEKFASSINGINPLYYATSGSCVVVFFDNGKANVISPTDYFTDDINKMWYFTEATDNTSKTPHALYHYDKFPDYSTLIIGYSKAKEKFKK